MVDEITNEREWEFFFFLRKGWFKRGRGVSIYVMVVARLCWLARGLISWHHERKANFITDRQKDRRTERQTERERGGREGKMWKDIWTDRNFYSLPKGQLNLSYSCLHYGDVDARQKRPCPTRPEVSIRIRLLTATHLQTFQPTNLFKA